VFKRTAIFHFGFAETQNALTVGAADIVVDLDGSRILHAKPTPEQNLYEERAFKSLCAPEGISFTRSTASLPFGKAEQALDVRGIVELLQQCQVLVGHAALAR